MTENTGPITPQEMIEMFGNECPIEAVTLLWSAPDNMMLAEIRGKLREMAASRPTAATLLERLRSEAVNWSATCGALFDEAADEIERLSAELAESRRMHQEAFSIAAHHQVRATTLLRACKSCDGEQYKFEEWAKAERYDMEEHPLHYLFMNAKTNAARMGWKAALHYVETALLPEAPTPTHLGKAD